MTSGSVDVDGHVLKLTNLDKVLYPETGFTKAEVIDYYVTIAPVLLPRLAGRPVTLRRYPDGADGPGFFEKHAGQRAPDWMRTAVIPTKRGKAETAEFVLVEDIAGLVWVANLAALELHVPQWRMGQDGYRVPPDLLVFDLDPGAPASIVECCRVAELLREALAADGLTAWPKTSGSKGMQLYVPVRVSTEDATAEYAQRLAERLARAHPDLVTATMTRTVRSGKVFIDWSQNRMAKTTVAAYSLRARPQPSASTPLTWDEVAAATNAADLVFTAAQVRKRVEEHGDLLAGLDDAHPALPE